MKAIKKTILFLIAIVTIASLTSCFYRVDGHRRWWWHHHHDFRPGPARLNNDDDGYDYYGLNNYPGNNTATTVSIEHTDSIMLPRP